MRVRPSFLKALVIIGALAALWSGAPRIGGYFAAANANVPGVAARTDTPAVATAHPADNHRQPRPRINPASLPAGTVWTFKDGAATHTYAIALDELYVPAGPSAERLRTLPLQSSLDTLLAAAAALAAQTGTPPRLVLYPVSGPRNEHSRRIVTPQVHIETDNLDAVRAAATSLGLAGWSTPDYAPGHALAQVEGDPAQPLRAAAVLAGLAHVTSAAPLLAAQHEKRALTLPNDPLFPQQWHLRNTGQQSGSAGIDINVVPVWPSFKGDHIAIGIVDDGVQLTHPDLSPNAALSGHYDWNGNDTNPAPDVTEDYHGTSVAGLAAARGDNGIGVSGVAPLATLYGLRLIAAPTTDSEDAEAMSWKNDVIQIKNNSWGPGDDTPWYLGYAGSLWQSAVDTGTTTGRGGLGTIYVFAAGNGKAYGDQGSKDAYAVDMHVIPVGAITNTGASASYSEGGAHLVVCAPGKAPSGIVTTDLTDSNGYNPDPDYAELSDQSYTQTFGGTSAATPIVSGVVALMLEANPALGWRDVKEILLRTSTQLQPSDSSWVTRDGGQPSLPLIKHHPFFGGGLVNAQAAISLAQTWTPLATAMSVTKSTTSGGQDIPDGGAALIIPLAPAASPILRVEHVEVTVNIVHDYRGDLEITLTSPAGTVSTLVASTTKDSGRNYDDWTFTSVRHWGESSAGTWKLSIRDTLSGYTGHFVSATLKIHGIAVDGPVVTLSPQDAVAATGTDVTLTAAATGSNLTYQWSRDGSTIAGATGATLNLAGITLAQAGTYTCKIANLAGSVTSSPAKVVVYTTADQSKTVNSGATFITPTVAAGPIDSFQWSYNGSPLTDSSRVTGTTTSTLTVRNITAADNGAYTLRAVVAGNTLPTGAVNFAVRLPPAVTAAAAQSLRLGSTAALVLTTDHGAYNYIYYGLPKGVTYNSATGVLGGRPTTTGIYPVVLMVTDAFGLTTTLSFTLTVEPPPAALVGVFNGTVARDASLNANLGGAITLTTTAKGLFTGKLTLGATAYAFKGALDGTSGAPGTVDVSILRTGLAPLHLQLSLPLDNTAATGTVNTSAAVAAWHNPWSALAPATAYAGPYTLALEPPAGSGRPAGYSIGTVTVATTGKVAWTLQPADGTAALKGATTLAADGTLPLFALVKTPAGSFVGALTLPSGTTPAASITGAVSWLRGPTASTPFANAAGFGPLDLTLHGGRYAAPAPGTVLLGLPATTNNTDLEFGGTEVDLGAQAAALAPFTLTLTNANKVVPPLVNPVALKLTVKPATGQFGGGFTLTDPANGILVKRTAKFSGVFLPQEGVGAGFFVLPALPGSGNGTRSGSVLLMEAP